MKILIYMKHTFINKKFISYCLAGAVNTFTASFFSWLAHLVIQENIAAYTGYIISLIINYFLNSCLVFKKRPSLISFLRFSISYIPSFIIYFLVTFITINLWQLPQFWATVLAAMAGGPITFIIIKLYAFGSRTEDLCKKQGK